MSRNMIEAWYAAEPQSRIVTTPEAAVAALLPLLTDNGDACDVERFAIAAMDGKGRLIDSAVLSTGSDRFTVVDPRQIFRWALTRKGRRVAASIVIGHNHPSGDPEPSGEDKRVTEAVVKAGRVVGIKLVDHIIIGSEGIYVSMAERGLCSSW